MIIRGQRAELRVGYQVAAAIGAFEATEEQPSALDQEKKPPQWSFSGEVKERNDFWLTRGPFELRVFVGESRQWKWKNVVPVFSGARVGATVEGAPEK